MSQYFFPLYEGCYTWTNVFFWGTFFEHCKKAYYTCHKRKRYCHLILAALECLPILSQIASICEKLLIVGWANPPSLKQLTQWNRQNVREYHRKLAFDLKCKSLFKKNSSFSTDSLFTINSVSDGAIMPSRNGLAKLANILISRHNLPSNSIQVCVTLVEFKEKLESIQTKQNDFRHAFIVPTHSSHRSGQKRHESNSQHIITVVVEKLEAKLHIALLDPAIINGNETINPKQIGLNFSEDIPFFEQELVLSYIVAANLNPRNTTLYHSKVLREVSNGCWAFALKDACEFLKQKNFFQDIKLEESSDMIHGFALKGIIKLPVNFIKIAQFKSFEFGDYFKHHPDQDGEMIRKKIAKHQIEQLNLRIAHATVKWLEHLRILALS